MVSISRALRCRSRTALQDKSSMPAVCFDLSVEPFKRGQSLSVENHATSELAVMQKMSESRVTLRNEVCARLRIPKLGVRVLQKQQRRHTCLRNRPYALPSIALTSGRLLRVATLRPCTRRAGFPQARFDLPHSRGVRSCPASAAGRALGSSITGKLPRLLGTTGKIIYRVSDLLVYTGKLDLKRNIQQVLM